MLGEILRQMLPDRIRCEDGADGRPRRGRKVRALTEHHSTARTTAQPWPDGTRVNGSERYRTPLGPPSRTLCSIAPLLRRARIVQAQGRSDERKVRKRLRKIANLPLRLRIVFFREQTDVMRTDSRRSNREDASASRFCSV
jgi:hypothetical protein